MFAEIQTDEEGFSSLEKLRKKVAEDIEL